jgi:HSP20 family protein
MAAAGRAYMGQLRVGRPTGQLVGQPDARSQRGPPVPLARWLHEGNNPSRDERRGKEIAMTEVKETLKTTSGMPYEKEIAPRRTGTPSRWYGGPFTMMRRRAEEMDRVFDDFGFESRLHAPSLFTRGRELLRRETGLVPAEWSPRVEVLEQEGQIVVRAELPGMTKDEVKVELAEKTLTMQGERKHEEKEEREGCFYSECSYGSFYRVIPLPEGVDTTKATAEFNNGVLEVRMPAPPHPQPKARRLEIQQGK